MDENLSEKIRALLADPAALSAIASVASSLSGSDAESAAQPVVAQTEQPDTPASVQASLAPRRDPRIDLLCAIKPLVNDQKRNRIENLVQIASVASLLGSLGKRGGGHV